MRKRAMSAVFVVVAAAVSTVAATAAVGLLGCYYGDSCGYEIGDVTTSGPGVHYVALGISLAVAAVLGFVGLVYALRTFSSQRRAKPALMTVAAGSALAAITFVVMILV